MNRRLFLQATGAVFAAGSIRIIFAQDTAGGAAAGWFREALDLMRAEGRPGLVIVVPDDAQSLWNASAQVTPIIRGGDLAAREVLSQAVVICMRVSQARDRIAGFGGRPGAMILIDDTATMIDVGGSWDDLTPERFGPAAARVVFGEFDTRLQERADRVRDAMSDEDREAFENLAGPEWRVREQATDTLAGRAAELTPLLVWMGRHESDLEVAGRCQEAFLRHFDSLGEGAAGRRLPFGVRWRERGGCGDITSACQVEEEELERQSAGMSVACGMAMVTEDERLFLQFLRP